MGLGTSYHNNYLKCSVKYFMSDYFFVLFRSIMASADLCEPCLVNSETSLVAKKYCTNCEDKLCAECADRHLRSKAFKYHQVIDLSSVGSSRPPSSIINCEIHTDVQIDYFCSQHDALCCGACLSDSHKSCETVIPLVLASKDVKNSSLLSDTLKELDNMTETLEKMSENRDDNRKLLEQKKSLIIKQISTARSELPKHIDAQRLVTEVGSVYEKNDEKIKKQKNEMGQLISVLKNNKQELEFLKNHGSNNQLFLALRKQITNIQKIEIKLHDMTSDINEIDMEFEESNNFKRETIGSLLQITRPCPIKFKSMELQHPQVQQDRRKTLTEFINEGHVNLKRCEEYNISYMAVTSDNKLLLCNYRVHYPRVFIYKDCKTYEDEIVFNGLPKSIAVVPCTDKAVVLVSQLKSIQFINTTNNTKEPPIGIGTKGGSITAVKDKIIIGGREKVLILNTDGSRVREITSDGEYKYNVLYNERNDQLLLKQYDRLDCISLDGHVIYKYNISGVGMAVDRQGPVYIAGCNEIQRLSPDGTFRDIVLSEHDGVDEPKGITFNNDFTKLFIISDNTTVLVYSCR